MTLFERIRRIRRYELVGGSVSLGVGVVEYYFKMCHALNTGFNDTNTVL